jgi:hypothetical protein
MNTDPSLRLRHSDRAGTNEQPATTAIAEWEKHGWVQTQNADGARYLILRDQEPVEHSPKSPLRGLFLGLFPRLW